MSPATLGRTLLSDSVRTSSAVNALVDDRFTGTSDDCCGDKVASLQTSLDLDPRIPQIVGWHVGVAYGRTCLWVSYDLSVPAKGFGGLDKRFLPGVVVVTTILAY